MSPSPNGTMSRRRDWHRVRCDPRNVREIEFQANQEHLKTVRLVENADIIAVAGSNTACCKTGKQRTKNRRTQGEARRNLTTDLGLADESKQGANCSLPQG